MKGRLKEWFRQQVWGIWIAWATAVWLIGEVNVGRVYYDGNLAGLGRQEMTWQRILLTAVVAGLAFYAAKQHQDRKWTQKRLNSLVEQIVEMHTESVELWVKLQQAQAATNSITELVTKQAVGYEAKIADLKPQVYAANERHKMAVDLSRLTQEQLAKANAEIIRLKG